MMVVEVVVAVLGVVVEPPPLTSSNECFDDGDGGGGRRRRVDASDDDCSGYDDDDCDDIVAMTGTRPRPAGSAPSASLCRLSSSDLHYQFNFLSLSLSFYQSWLTFIRLFRYLAEPSPSDRSFFNIISKYVSRKQGN